MPRLRAAACALLLATLAACGDGGEVADQAAPAGQATPAEPVLQGLWDLRAPGEPPGTVLNLTGGDFLLMRPCGEVTGTWGARGGLFLGQAAYGTGEDPYPGSSQALCPAAERAVPSWLDDVAGYRPDGTGWDLLDLGGTPVADLTAGASWPVNHAQDRGYTEITMGEDDPWPSLPERAQLNAQSAAPLPPPVRPATAPELIGRWEPAQPESSQCDDAFIEFQPNGSWVGSDGGLEAGGGWRLGEAGLALGSAAGPRGGDCGAVVVNAEPRPRTYVEVWMLRLARLGFDRAALVFYDPDGAELARVHRAAPPTPEPTPVPQEPADPRYAGVKVPGGVKYLVPYAEHQMYFGPQYYSPEYENDWANDAILGVDHSGKGAILLTGCSGGDMWITVRPRTSAPPALAKSMSGWEVGEEQTMTITKPLFGADWDGLWYEKIFTPTVPGLHRVRVLAKGRATSYDDVCERPVEEYEITIWPVLAKEPRERRGDDGI